MVEYKEIAAMGMTPEQEDAATGLTAQQRNEIESKYRFYKATYCYGLNVWDDKSVLSDDEVAEVQKRITLLQLAMKDRNGPGLNKDASIIVHVIGELQSRLKINDRLRWNALPQAERDRLNMVINHPEWRVKSNAMLDMTGAIVEESQSLDVQMFQALVIGNIIAGAMGTPGSPAGAEAPPSLLRAAGDLGKRLLARGASPELAEFATLTEEELAKVRGGMAQMKTPRMTAADLNDFVAQEKPGMGPKMRLTTPERNAARQIVSVLERVRNGDSWAWAELIPGRGADRMKMCKFGDLAKKGWAEIDLLENNPGAYNKMRMLVRRVPGDIDYKLIQMH
jgi:hypothetical protein